MSKSPVVLIDLICIIFSGQYYYEAIVSDEGLCRVGWATEKATLNLGTDKFGFGFGGTGKKSFNKQFDDYGEVSSNNICVSTVLLCPSMTYGSSFLFSKINY